MKRRDVGRLTVLALGLWLVGMVEVVQADEKGATGTWTLVVEPRPPDGRLATLKLKQDGDKLTGTVTLPGGQSSEIQDGKITGSRISFFIEPMPNGPKIHHMGTLTGDTIKGKLEFERDGKRRPGLDWEAKRVAD